MTAEHTCGFRNRMPLQVQHHRQASIAIHLRQPRTATPSSRNAASRSGSPAARGSVPAPARHRPNRPVRGPLRAAAAGGESRRPGRCAPRDTDRTTRAAVPLTVAGDGHHFQQGGVGEVFGVVAQPARALASDCPRQRRAHRRPALLDGLRSPRVVIGHGQAPAGRAECGAGRRCEGGYRSSVRGARRGRTGPVSITGTRETTAVGARGLAFAGARGTSPSVRGDVRRAAYVGARPSRVGRVWP